MNEKNPVKFLGFVRPSSIYAKFRIETPEYEEIIVAHGGDWTKEGAMSCHHHYKAYEDVQADLGAGYEFKAKEYVSLLKRTFFKFERESLSDDYSIVVPATGEEIYLEIYGVNFGRLYLLWHGEI